MVVLEGRTVVLLGRTVMPKSLCSGVTLRDKVPAAGVMLNESLTEDKRFNMKEFFPLISNYFARGHGNDGLFTMTYQPG